jgi:hypothetical protein
VSDKELDKVIDFIQKYAPQYQDREKIREYTLEHFNYKTTFVGLDDNKEVTFVCRWNIDGDVADILDLYIREDYRNKKLIQQLLQRGIWIFPMVRFIRFERNKKYPNREKSLIPVEKILKERE